MVEVRNDRHGTDRRSCHFPDHPVKISVLKETADGERRVAVSAETVKKFIGLGATVSVENGAGAAASVADADLAAAGATMGTRAETI